VRVRAKFVAAAVDARHFPLPGPPEVAFLGRANVGKSSLINSLLNERKLAKTSSTPGRTKAINFFEVRRPGHPHAEFYFADLPGYGYSKLPRELTAEWPKFIEPYLQKRETLVLCVVLVDSNISPQASDRQLLEWLKHVKRPHVVVATKADRLSGNQIAHSLKALEKELETRRLLTFSARTGAGREDLWREIRQAAETVS
jgi:GTP-binding protein